MHARNVSVYLSFFGWSLGTQIFQFDQHQLSIDSLDRSKKNKGVKKARKQDFCQFLVGHLSNDYVNFGYFLLSLHSDEMNTLIEK